MSNLLSGSRENDNNEPTQGEVALRVYDYLEIENSLAAYLDGEAEENDIEPLLYEFAAWMAWLGKNDLKVFQAGFERLTQSMNEVAREKFEKPQKEKTLLTLKLKSEKSKREYVRELDDHYWTKQFPEQYVTGMVPRNAKETEQEYTSRYVYACMHGLLFAPFTYLR